MKIIVVLLILCILAALGSALYQLMQRREGASDKLVKALTVRVALSVFLFLLLILSHKVGLIHPHGLNNWKP